MTRESAWVWTSMGAKLVLGAALVAGVLAFAEPAQASTTSINGINRPDLVFNDDNEPPANTTTNTLFLGDNWSIGLSAEDFGNPEAGSAFLQVIAGEQLNTVAFTVQNPQDNTAGAAFVGAQIGWDTQSDGLSGSAVFEDIPTLGRVNSTTAILAGEIKHLIWKWDGMVEDFASMITTLSAEVPLPAGLVLFLGGLAGIGFLGRCKAKRREPAVA